jgi:hypothetical protein
MKHFLSGAMAAGWFCLAMAVFAQFMSVSSDPIMSAPAAAGGSSAPGKRGECPKQATDQKIVGPQREDVVESCMTEQ